MAGGGPGARFGCACGRGLRTHWLPVLGLRTSIQRRTTVPAAGVSNPVRVPTRTSTGAGVNYPEIRIFRNSKHRQISSVFQLPLGNNAIADSHAHIPRLSPSPHAGLARPKRSSHTTTAVFMPHPIYHSFDQGKTYGQLCDVHL